MGQQFEIRIVGIGTNGCDKTAVVGGKLRHRCKQLDCVDCRALDLVQMLRQYGYLVGVATLTHNYGTVQEVVDDMITNVRKSGSLITVPELQESRT